MSGSAGHVALLRGVNVAGKNALSKAALVELFTEAGCRDVQTYIQSGNVVFRAPAKLLTKLPATVAANIEKRHGLRTPVILRSAAELHAAIDANPFLREDGPLKALHVMFLADAPTRARIAGLDTDRSPTDRFAVVGREVYLHCPDGLGRSRLTNAYFDSKLGTTSTIRNWNTVLKLAELADALG